jgi:ABC-type multidrug transport system fused ATPase/permease subunit
MKPIGIWADLLIRFYDVVDGSINIDNINVKKINLSQQESKD